MITVFVLCQDPLYRSIDSDTPSFFTPTDSRGTRVLDIVVT